jgi:WD40 repeat protein
MVSKIIFDIKVFLLEKETWKLVDKIQTASNVNNICYSPNKKYLGMATDGSGIQIYDPISFERLFYLSPTVDNEKSIFVIGEIQSMEMALDCCSFSSNSKYICGSGTRGAIIWDVETREIVYYLGIVTRNSF